MKKYPAFMAIIAAFLIFSQSCKKDQGPDLTESIVGSYNGTVQDSVVGVNNITHNNQVIVITKVDNSHVRVSANGTLADYFEYEAELIESSTGVVLTIPSQQSGGSTIEGLPITTVNGASASGSYNSSTKVFGSLVRSTTGSPTVIEATSGTKQ
jgi:hypothetical protein